MKKTPHMAPGDMRRLSARVKRTPMAHPSLLEALTRYTRTRQMTASARSCNTSTSISPGLDSASSDVDLASSRTSSYTDPADDGDSLSSTQSNEQGLSSSDDDETCHKEDGELVDPIPKRRKIHTSIARGDTVAVGGKVNIRPKPVAKRAAGGKKETRNVDAWSYKGGITEDLPPMSDINEIFDDLTANAARHGLREVVKSLESYKVKVATMCSGTESPILALGLISESEWIPPLQKSRSDLPGLMKHFRLKLEIEHLFRAEIVPFKQAYIERNFSPPIIFRDITELQDATEA